jgi:hypothetical protein
MGSILRRRHRRYGPLPLLTQQWQLFIAARRIDRWRCWYD